jgi:hypothetical protein
MRVNKRLILCLTVLLVIAGCIDPYTPDLGEGNDMIVINGRITDQEGYQYVEVSRTSDIYNPIKQPVSGCSIQIENEGQKIFSMTEINEGRYACQMSKEDLLIGTKYRLLVLTPDNKHYQSDFEKLMACPPIDSITYEECQKELSNPDRNVNAIQFYLYSNASGDFAENYMWEMTETWEYRSKYIIGAIYAGELTELKEPTDTFNTCYRSAKITDIFTHSTRNVTNSRIQKFPLNYVTDETDRLSWKYSLNVRQFSLSQKAFDYFNTIRELSKETGGMYETQPANIPGNIYNTDDPDEKVTGLFYASSVTEKRIFVKVHYYKYSLYCTAYGLRGNDLLDFLGTIDRAMYPVYLLYVDRGVYDYADQECIDCRKYGGNIIKPEYWE